MRAAAILAVIVTASAPSLCLGAASDQERIDAVSEFLLERAQANLLYIFERRIADDRAVRCYFPTIYGYVSDGDLKLLLKGRAIWGETIRSDLENLVARSAAKAFGNAVDLGKAASDATSRYLELAQYASVRYQGAEYPLTSIPLGASQELRDLIGGFWQVNDLRDLMLEADKRLKDVDPVCKLPKISVKDIRDFTAALKRATVKLDAWKQHFETHRKDLVVNTQKLDSDCRANPSRWFCADRKRTEETGVPTIAAALSAQAGASLAAVAELDAYLAQIGEAKTNTAKVVITIELLKKSGADDETIESFKRYVLFFAELSDADSGTEIKQILQEYTMPAVSFAAKREKYKSHVFVSSYVGVVLGRVTNSDQVGGRKNSNGIYAPVGVEYSYGLRNRNSVGLLVAPFDFGYPISLKLNGVTDSVNWSDVIAPSVMVSQGLANYPLSWGLAYQWGRRDEITGAVEHRAMLFLGFDMPLFALY